MTYDDRKKVGLIGTITRDFIVGEAGRLLHEGIGGILYQAAVLCGLSQDVFLFTNLGGDIQEQARPVYVHWPTLRTEGIRVVTGPGNRVRLHYPPGRERWEILESVVPAIDPQRILEGPRRLDMLIMVLNSGFDIELRDWRTIVREASCPLWLDIHTLILSPDINIRRRFRSLPEWREWAEGVDFLQANRKEIACMLGRPDESDDWPPAGSGQMTRFAGMAFDVGIKTVFVTLGSEGALVMTPGGIHFLEAPKMSSVSDTTGCGDVFAAMTAFRLMRGDDPFEAGSRGVAAASKAAAVSGVEAAFRLACELRVE